MIQKTDRRKLFVTLVALGLLVLVVAIVAVVRSMPSSETSMSTETAKKEAPETTDKSENTDIPAATEPTDTATEPMIDPATIATVTIEPVSLTVSYLKGVGGFDFEVFRTTGGTKYIQFSSPKLVGTKCTDDRGQFASIIENPSTDESATLAKTTTVNGTTYGLSLAEATCTSDSNLLKQYQDAFSEPFSLLKKM